MHNTTSSSFALSTFSSTEWVASSSTEFTSLRNSCGLWTLPSWLGRNNSVCYCWGNHEVTSVPQNTGERPPLCHWEHPQELHFGKEHHQGTLSPQPRTIHTSSIREMLQVPEGPNYLLTKLQNFPCHLCTCLHCYNSVALLYILYILLYITATVIHSLLIHKCYFTFMFTYCYVFVYRPIMHWLDATAFHWPCTIMLNLILCVTSTVPTDLICHLDVHPLE